MKTIRTNCFETNSSSTHSVTIDNTVFAPDMVKGQEIYPGEFGWEWNKFNDFARKTSYFWTLVVDYPREHGDLKGQLERLANKYEFMLLPIREGSYCYVDHGWEHYEKFISQHPELTTDDGLFEFLTSKACWIMLGNDNGHGEPNFRLTPSQIENAPRFFVLDVDPTFRYAMVGEQSEEDYAIEAVCAWREKNMSIRDQCNEGWLEILVNVGTGTIECVIKKYSYQTSKSSIVKKFTLTYTIEHNDKYVATSL